MLNNGEIDSPKVVFQKINKIDKDITRLIKKMN